MKGLTSEIFFIGFIYLVVSTEVYITDFES